MTLDQAQKLVADLGASINAAPGSFTMNDRGESNLVYDETAEVLIKHFENCLILGCAVADDIGLADPGLFPTLMDYQYLGIRTFGNVLSWNSDGSSLLLSRHIFGEPTAADLANELERLLRAAQSVREDLEMILDGNWQAAAIGETEAEESALPRFLDRA
jgi:Tir chaperone protein (CesT) family